MKALFAILFALLCLSCASPVIHTGDEEDGKVKSENQEAGAEEDQAAEEGGTGDSDEGFIVIAFSRIED